MAGDGIVFSPELEQVISEVLPSDDPFGSPSFDAVDCINKNFPNEHSLGNLDSWIQKLKGDMRRLDEEILVAVRQQSSAGDKAKQDLEEGKAAMRALYSKIRLIREKSEQSEAVVQEIGRDIKVLDHAKRHLVTTITTLKRFHNLTTNVEQLQGMGERRQYKEAGSKLEAVNGLCSHFESFKAVPRVNELRESVARMKAFLQKQILEEFAGMEAETLDGKRAESLKDACEVVNALGPEVRDQVLQRFCTAQLVSYGQQFKPPGEGAGLDKADLRYKWLKKQLRVYEEQFSRVFPAAWRADRRLCEEFCAVTRSHFVEVLDVEHERGEVGALVKTLQRTIEFETDLTHRFQTAAAPGEDSETVRRQSKDGRGDPGDLGRRVAEHEKDRIVFRGLVSSCFEPYMGPYLDLVDKNLSKKLSEVLKEEKWDLPQDAAGSTNKVLQSSVELFLFMKGSLKECSMFTRNQTLFNMQRLFKKYLKMYADALTAKLPRVSSGAAAVMAAAALLHDREEQVKLTEKEERTVCLVVNTADYCSETIGQLAESIRRVIEKQFLEAVDLSAEQEEFSGAITKAVRILVLGVETKVQGALEQMTRMNWSAVEAVGDQSPYVSTIGGIFQSTVPTLAHLLSDTHFRFFCDKLVASLIPRYVVSIYRCKRLNDIGAQQLQVDAHALKGLLLQIPATLTHEVPASYQKYVEKEMAKVDTLLKVLLAPPDALSDTYHRLVPDGSAADFAKILELKGLKSAGIKLPGSLGPLSMKKNPQPSPSPNPTGTGAAAAAAAAGPGGQATLADKFKMQQSSLADKFTSMQEKWGFNKKPGAPPGPATGSLAAPSGPPPALPPRPAPSAAGPSPGPSASPPPSGSGGALPPPPASKPFTSLFSKEAPAGGPGGSNPGQPPGAGLSLRERFGIGDSSAAASGNSGEKVSDKLKTAGRGMLAGFRKALE
eukprot:tig00020554_g10829.t1